MHNTMFPLLILNVLENHATREHPLTITEITNFVNREFAAFTFEKKQLTFLPYYLWNNRGVGEMTVWVNEIQQAP